MLSSSHRLLPGIALLLFAVLGPSAETSEPQPTPKQIAQWIKQLGDNNFKVRENASKKLWQAGPAAESALEKVVKGDDPEVVRRGRELLDKFHWGIYPDTPENIVALIRAYQASEGNPRLDVVGQLLDSGEAGVRAIRKIVSAEKDEDQRKMLGDLVVNKLSADFFLAVTEGKYEAFERLLELGHEYKFIHPNQYAAYWLLRGRLAERIAHFRARLKEHPKDSWLAQTLAYLHRANGDLVEARKAAEKSNRLDLLEGILYELGDWKTLAAKGPLHIAAAESPTEKWAYRAAFARLAGERKGFDDAVRELRKCAESKTARDTLAFLVAKGLLLNDRPAEGMELLRALPDRRELLFDVHCARLDFDTALDLATKEIAKDKETSTLALARARLLCWLGDKEGESLFDRYAERIKDGVDPYWVKSLLDEEVRAGLMDRAFAHAAKALSVAPPKNSIQSIRERLYFAQLFPQQEKTAEVWWTELRQPFWNESPTASLKRLRQLLEGKVAAKEVDRWITMANARISRVDGPADLGRELGPERQALAEAAILAGLDKYASSLLKSADNQDALLRLGDLYAAKKQWDEAAKHYRRAWTKQMKEREAWQARPGPGEKLPIHIGKEDLDPLPLYLEGNALVRVGREKEGKKLIEQAHWIPFANAEVRYNFLRALSERGHKEAAQRETELLLSASEPNTFYAGAAILRVASAALARKDYLKSAEGFEQSMLGCLSSTIGFVESAAFANVPAKIHQVRACGLLAAGKLDEALKHADLALTHSPGFVELSIALVPELERRGHKEEATDLFNRVNETYEKLSRKYPRCAWIHNQTAWLSACCRRNLDAALPHAEKAVELEPNRAGYLDTLAEVHFQRGNKDKAIAVQKRVLALNPKKAYYQKQLKRLEAGDPSIELPSEDDG